MVYSCHCIRNFVDFPFPFLLYTAEREEGRINDECKRVRVRREELKERMNGYQVTYRLIKQKHLCQ